MKLCKVKNVSSHRLVILAVRDRNGKPFVFEPGECKQMMPATVNHPAVSVHIGRGLQLVEEQIAVDVPKIKVLEPAVSPAPPPAPKVETPVVEPEVEAEVIQEAPATHVSIYAEAPGVTKDEIASLEAAFPTLSDLANATRDSVMACGFGRVSARKLISWAVSNLVVPEKSLE